MEVAPWLLKRYAIIYATNLFIKRLRSTMLTFFFLHRGELEGLTVGHFDTLRVQNFILFINSFSKQTFAYKCLSEPLFFRFVFYLRGKSKDVLFLTLIVLLLPIHSASYQWSLLSLLVSIFNTDKVVRFFIRSLSPCNWQLFFPLRIVFIVFLFRAFVIIFETSATTTESFRTITFENHVLFFLQRVSLILRFFLVRGLMFWTL